jgi:fructose-1,6-bisphosphatase II
MLYNGEEVGNGVPPEVDVAVDPLEGTRLTSVGQPNAIAVIAVAERGTMFFPGAAVYMDKLVGGEQVAEAVSIDATPAENVNAAAAAKEVKPSEIAVVVLDRDRNQPIIDGLREAGAKVNLITDGDVAPAIAAAREGTGVDLMMGIGGTPEGVIAAAAVKCLGGVVQGRLWPRNDEERQALVDAGYDPDRVLVTDDLVAGDNVFVSATGVTDGALLRGVRFTRGGAQTESIVMRSRSGTVRRIQAQHALDKLERFSGRVYR